ncbi:MAG: oxidoreductase, partial [Paeniglutamicibacter sp.]
MNKSTASRMRDLGAFGLAGFAAAAVLFSVAQFVSAFFATASAPMVAMGSVFIDLTPPWLKDFAIATFGTNDKLALFISIGVIAAIAAVLVGILARRSYALAATCIVVLAVAIGAAVLSRPATGVVDLTPTILGSVAGLAALRWLTALAAKARPPVPGGTPVHGASRRNFLIGTAVSLVGAAVATGVGKSLATARNVADAARSALGLPPAAVTAPPPP